MHECAHLTGHGKTWAGWASPAELDAVYNAAGPRCRARSLTFFLTIAHARSCVCTRMCDRALARFRTHSTTCLRLPPELQGRVRSFLVQDVETQARRDYALVVALLPHVMRTRHLKRCTPCSSCHLRNTYSQYCTDCDARLWLTADCTNVLSN